MSLRTSTQRPAWMKRAISLLLTAVMVVGLLPAAAPGPRPTGLTPIWTSW